jgi:hypothetical protein
MYLITNQSKIKILLIHSIMQALLKEWSIQDTMGGVMDIIMVDGDMAATPGTTMMAKIGGQDSLKTMEKKV